MMDGGDDDDDDDEIDDSDMSCIKKISVIKLLLSLMIINSDINDTMIILILMIQVYKGNNYC